MTLGKCDTCGGTEVYSFNSFSTLPTENLCTCEGAWVTKEAAEAFNKQKTNF